MDAALKGLLHCEILRPMLETHAFQALKCQGGTSHGLCYRGERHSGDFLIYSISGGPLWDTHAHAYSDLTLTMQSDGNAVAYQWSQSLWATASPSKEINYWPSNFCSLGEFVYAFLQDPTDGSAHGGERPDTSSTNLRQVQVGDPIQSNPLDTAKPGLASIATTSPVSRST